jgi:PIN domain nuclease of toxin-antitoxin system
MNYLLDTHVFLWMLSDPGRLNAEAKEAICHPNHSVFVSAVSAVEISIKKRLGKLVAPDSLEQEIESRGLQHLPLTFRHGMILETLPNHHLDPFDRMLVAQALCENLIVVSHDKKLEPYPVRMVWT